jgi:hypothetical protein
MVAYVMPGDRDTIDGREVVFTQSIAIGHKVAVRDIKAGERNTSVASKCILRRLTIIRLQVAISSQLILTVCGTVFRVKT